jgi:hypothetical protein
MNSDAQLTADLNEARGSLRAANLEIRQLKADIHLREKEHQRTLMSESTDVRYRHHIQFVSGDDVAHLLKKDEEYGASWKRRGGVGAYMMMIRKIDRIVALIPEPDGHPTHGFDVFAMLADESVGGSEQLLDTMRDLRGYLTLIEAEHRVRTGDLSKQPVTYEEVMSTPPDLVCPGFSCGRIPVLQTAETTSCSAREAKANSQPTRSETATHGAEPSEDDDIPF